MKFGKRLKKQVEESLPEWRDKFLAYKRLKRLVRLVPSSPPPRRRAAEAAFVRLLDGEVDRFNAFFLEQEEDFVIRHRELQEAVKKVVAGDREAAAEVRRVRREVVDLHGEMVLLLNYSAINYTGLAKILKKYDKRTGRLLRLPFIEKVLGQPFFATELISRLVHECEATMEAVFEAGGGRSGAGATPVAAAATEQGIFRNTIAALVTMGELRSGSSTYGHFSLPPMASPESDLLRCLQVADPVPI
ncbi:hypothetical protein PAHAL_9G294000 [Panicum hallii]|uniref:SPX domain-containing protein n=1 Tax=Panicum hallii TaxID=206008 RepID=A0A2S3IME0_9POAL|nr:SPX domain-containing protein 3 [Panicum hallii]XP_025795013.1 SPX domain-containing protein 3 [Panicum hallii]PAN47468.1 hypothetical protein PAHAL_9G294000 [Panicum hallii]PAN47469.1 hypothetical protein PAHAL_9G294000 [Panicum hallii]